MGLKIFDHEAKCVGCDDSPIEVIFGNQNSNIAFSSLMIWSNFDFPALRT